MCNLKGLEDKIRLFYEQNADKADLEKARWFQMEITLGNKKKMIFFKNYLKSIKDPVFDTYFFHEDIDFLINDFHKYFNAKLENNGK